MRRIYWRPKAVSRTGLALIAMTALAGLLFVETVRVTNTQPLYDLKLAATEVAAEAMEAIYYQRSTLDPVIDSSTDPTESGLIGLPMSSVTSISGSLAAKQTSVNPNFAAVVIDMLRTAGVQAGDVVAVGLSGSFPALNVCVYAAMESMQVKPIVICSVAASQWGANHPDLLWIDMEKILAEQNILQIRANAASIGGYEDRGLGMSAEGLQRIEESIARNGIPRLDSDSFEQAVEERMKLYREQARGKPIKAYINVGGGTISTGRSLGKKLFRPGVNFRPPGRLDSTIDGVMPRFIADGIPCIHFVQIAQLANSYEMPVPPIDRPVLGDATVFSAKEYNKIAAATVLGLLTAMMYGFVRSDVGSRLLKFGGKRKADGQPEPMV